MCWRLSAVMLTSLLLLGSACNDTSRQRAAAPNAEVDPSNGVNRVEGRVWLRKSLGSASGLLRDWWEANPDMAGDLPEASRQRLLEELEHYQVDLVDVVVLAEEGPTFAVDAAPRAEVRYAGPDGRAGGLTDELQVEVVGPWVYADPATKNVKRVHLALDWTAKGEGLPLVLGEARGYAWLVSIHLPASHGFERHRQATQPTSKDEK